MVKSPVMGILTPDASSQPNVPGDLASMASSIEAGVLRPFYRGVKGSDLVVPAAVWTGVTFDTPTIRDGMIASTYGCTVPVAGWYDVMYSGLFRNNTGTWVTRVALNSGNNGANGTNIMRYDFDTSVPANFTLFASDTVLLAARDNLSVYFQNSTGAGTAYGQSMKLVVHLNPTVRP